MNPTIHVSGLSFSYEDKPVLKDAGFHIHPKTLAVIMGLNGSGKSTLLRLLGGVLPYSEGTVKISDREIKTLTFRQRAGIVGFLPQKHKAVFPFSVEEVVLTGRASFIPYIPRQKDREAVLHVLEKMGIADLAGRKYTELSGGEQQLVMIARVLAQQPRVLLLDEPVSHLDFRNQMTLMKMLKTLVGEGVSVVVSMHEPNLAFGFGDAFLFLHQNKVHQIGEENPWDHPLIGDAFGKHARKVEVQGKSFFLPA